jgi:predicted nucleic acid-binding protein
VGALILDASVLIGLLDSKDPHHDAAVEAVELADQAARELITPASAYSEALDAFARADRITDAHNAVAGMGITVTPMNAVIAERAAALRASHSSLRLPDAIVLATALELDGELMTYDQQLAKRAPAREDRPGATAPNDAPDAAADARAGGDPPPNS